MKLLESNDSLVHSTTFLRWFRKMAAYLLFLPWQLGQPGGQGGPWRFTLFNENSPLGVSLLAIFIITHIPGKKSTTVFSLLVQD